MKKYFMKETGNEVQFGDLIELDLEGRSKDGKRKKTMHLECKFTPELIPILKERDLLEEKEVEEEIEEYVFNFDTEEEWTQFLLDNISNLVERCEDLEGRLTVLEEAVSKLLEKKDDKKAA